MHLIKSSLSVVLLIRALWSPINTPAVQTSADALNSATTAQVSIDANQHRYHALSQWLQYVVSFHVRSQLDIIDKHTQHSNVHAEDAVAAGVFTLLCGNQLVKACQYATKGGDVRLASLLAQAGTNDTVKHDIRYVVMYIYVYSSMMYCLHVYY